MDLEKLIESQSKLAAKTPPTADARAAGAEAVNRPIELQQAQADRVKDRIESLEKSKAALIESIDAELQELKGEHEARTRKIEADRKNLEPATSAVSEAPGIRTKKVAEAATKDAAAAPDPNDKKTTRASSAKDAKPD